jgi:hypothetical protein
MNDQGPPTLAELEDKEVRVTLGQQTQAMTPSTDNEEYAAVLCLRELSIEPDASDSVGIVAVDGRSRDNEKREADAAELQDHLLAHCVGLIASPPDLYKFGAALREHLKVEIAAETAAQLLGLEEADADLSRALTSALFGTIATSLGPTYLDVGLHAIASFVHSYPSFKDAIKKDAWEPPFGEHTTYKPAKVSRGQDQRAKEAEAPA